jgi:L-2,4-diaminobutyrate decarboxylase
MWDMTEFEQAAGITIGRLADHVARSERGEGPVVARRPLAEITADLDLRRLIREGGLDADGYAGFLDGYLARTTRLHHPGALAHQVAVPDVPAALADLIHGATNNPMAIYEMGPAGAAIEVAVIDWMLELVGWDPAQGAGVLTHGGSLANLTALLGARARAAPGAWTEGVDGDLAILAPPSAHYSVARAVAILGLGEAALFALEVDGLDRVRTDRLDDALARVRAAGRRPVALVAAACATGTGLYDDLEAIGQFCRARGIWLHVDGAHGASALLSPEHRGRLAGIEHADSVVWDAHKMLRTSGLCAAVLFRRADDLTGAFHQQASYLFYDGVDDPAGIDLLLGTVECTKTTLGLKLFLNLAFRGERGLGAYVAAQYEKTRRFHALIAARPGFECPYEPESNILCFRYGRDGAAQVAIRERLIDAGSFHLSSAEVGGERYLRLSVMSPATDEATIEALLDAIEAAA